MLIAVLGYFQSALLRFVAVLGLPGKGYRRRSVPFTKYVAICVRWKLFKRRVRYKIPYGYRLPAESFFSGQPSLRGACALPQQSRAARVVVSF